jgi:hypothetical protein
MARGEHAAQHCLPARETRLQLALARREARELGLRRAPFCLERAQRAVGIRDRALGVAQRVACLAPAGLLLAQARLECLDARAQRGQVLLAIRAGCGGRGEGDAEQDERPDQGLAFPWAVTAATRRATSAASPR